MVQSSSQLNSNYTVSAGDGHKTIYFTPLATIIGFIFIGVNFFLLAIIKIYYLSSDQYNIQNRFDLVIFKPPTKSSNRIGLRRIYKNSKASMHNLNAAIASGFDVSKLNDRQFFAPVFASQNEIEVRSTSIQENNVGTAKNLAFSETPLNG
jgi:hypothetical protein